MLLLNEFGLYDSMPGPLRSTIVCLLIATVIVLAWLPSREREGGA